MKQIELSLTKAFLLLDFFSRTSWCSVSHLPAIPWIASGSIFYSMRGLYCCSFVRGKCWIMVLRYKSASEISQLCYRSRAWEVRTPFQLSSTFMQHLNSCPSSSFHFFKIQSYRFWKLLISNRSACIISAFYHYIYCRISKLDKISKQWAEISLLQFLWTLRFFRSKVDELRRTV